MSESLEWLDGLEQGDPIAIYSGGVAATVELAEVSRRTPTLLVVLAQGERKFRTTTGRELGGNAELRPVDHWQVRSALVRQHYARAMLDVYQIERRVDRTNPRSSELYAVALRQATETLTKASAAVDTLLGLSTTERRTDAVDE
jgi:hypothetical protein